MRIKAALYNADHLEYGLVTIPFPIPQDQYNDTIKMLEALDIGDPRAKDCMVEEIEGCVPSLKCLEGHRINVDELDYLVKRLDSFSDGELVQFQGMAAKMGLSDMTDLINLTFCCQQATVITDFSDLEQIGRDHYMNLHGGCVSTEELEELDGMETALLLISENDGTVTPYYDEFQLVRTTFKEDLVFELPIEGSGAFSVAPSGDTFLFQGGYQEHNKFYFLTAHGDRLGQKREAIPTCDGNKVAVEQCSLLCSQMLFLGKNGVLYGGVLGESVE